MKGPRRALSLSFDVEPEVRRPERDDFREPPEGPQGLVNKAQRLPPANIVKPNVPVPVVAELVASVNDLLDKPFPFLGDLRVEEEGCPDPQLVKEVE